MGSTSLIAALEEDPGDWQSPASTQTIGSFLRNIFLMDFTDNKLKEVFQFAWISGIVYLLMFIINVGITSLPEENTLNTSATLIPVNILLIISFTGFTRGYLALARLFEIQLLKISAYLSLVFVAISWILEILTISISSLQEFSSVVSFFTLVIIGASSLLFGYGLLRLQDGMGRMAKIAGRLEIIFGISYLSIIFSFIGLILLGPIMIIEIVMLSKAEQQVRKGDL